MNYSIPFLTVALLTSSATAAGTEVTAKVPVRFQGEWVHDLKKCGKPEELYFKLGEKDVTFYESLGPIKTVVVRGNEIVMVAELSGEEEVWLAPLHYELSKDGKQLVDKSVYPPETRRKCP